MRLRESSCGSCLSLLLGSCLTRPAVCKQCDTTKRHAFFFQHAVLLFTQAICSFIPDTPGSVRLQVQRENLLQRENLFSEQKRQIKDEKSEARGRWRAAGEGVAVVSSLGAVMIYGCQLTWLISAVLMARVQGMSAQVG